MKILLPNLGLYKHEISAFLNVWHSTRSIVNLKIMNKKLLIFILPFGLLHKLICFANVSIFLGAPTTKPLLEKVKHCGTQ